MTGEGSRSRANEVHWEETPCPLCQGDDHQPFLSIPAGEQTYRLVRCRCCTMIFLNPRPDERSIGLLYPEEYEWYQRPEGRDTWWQTFKRRLQRRVMARRFGNPPPLEGWPEKLAAVLAGPWLRPSAESMMALPFLGLGRLLDYGCGSGWYARRMKELGWHVTGMDLSEHAAQQVRQNYGIPVVVGTLPHSQIEAESFDVITMGSVLEHVHQPHRVIAAAAEALQPGGCLVVAVPNIAGWGYRRFGPQWWGLQLPHHLLHFTPLTLRWLLETHGLQVAQVQMVGRPNWMRRTLAQARQADHRGPLVSLTKLRPLSGLLTRWTVRTGQADCIQAVAYRPSRPAAAGVA